MGEMFFGIFAMMVLMGLTMDLARRERSTWYWFGEDEDDRRKGR